MDARQAPGHGKAKLTPEDVRAIREKSKTHTCVWIAAHYGVTPASISNILTGRTWKNVT